VFFRYSLTQIILSHKTFGQCFKTQRRRCEINIFDFHLHYFSPWKAKILDGNLDIDPSETQFLLSKLTESKEYTRKVMVTNTLRDPLVLYKIEIGLEAENFFTISDLEEPLFVQPHQPSKLFTLTKCDPSEVGHTLCPEEDFDLESTITLYTNASTFIYPLVYYSGMIKYEVIWIDKNIQRNRFKSI
jgi:hypothetical protein